MKKRIISALLIASMLSGTLFMACGNTNASNTEVTESEIANENSEMATEATEDALTALSLMEEINSAAATDVAVLDDNYRTYYEIFVYSFYDSDGDGIGDLKGLTEKLDYINDGDAATDTDLGCNGIWLMPIMPSTTYHKYDVTDYENIDAEYGTLEDFATFIQASHERGINVIIDLVMNHTSSQHEWFQTAYGYLQSLPAGTEPDLTECPYVDYYNFSREKGTGYSEVEGTEWYYEAQFWSEMPDLNLANESVRQEFDAIVDFWLELGVDGFRLDAAKEFYSGADSKNIEVLTWFNDMVKEKKEDAYIVAEVWNDMTTYSKYYESGIDSCFDFAFANSDGVIANTLKRASGADATIYGTRLESLQEMLAANSDTYIDAPFYTNHDMARSAGYYSGDYSEAQTKIAQAMNLFMSGSAFLYYGEELGMKGAGKDENKRAPMYWSMDAQAAGMCDGPKDMDTVKMKYDSLEEQEADGNSIYQYVKETIALRNQYPEISHGIVTVETDLSNENVCVLRKTYEDSEVLLVFNLSEEAQSIDISATIINEKAPGEAALGGVLLTGTEQVVLDGTGLTLPSYSVTVLK